MRYPLLSLLSLLFLTVSCYDIVDDFSGLSFFDNWDFYGNYDNLTLGVSPFPCIVCGFAHVGP